MIEAESTERQFACVSAGICPDCGADLPAGGKRASVVCAVCGERWSLEHTQKKGDAGAPPFARQGTRD